MKALVIGAGNAGKQHIKAYKTAGFEVSYTDSPKDGLKDLVKQADVVSVASPDSYHFFHSLIALMAKKHLMVEKPAGLLPQDATRLKSELEISGARMCCNFPLRKHLGFESIRRRMQEGWFGNIYLVEMEYNWGRKHKLFEGWRKAQGKDYSVILGGGTHMIDLFIYLTGDEIRDVHAFGTNMSIPGLKAHTVVGVFHTAANVIGKLTCNFGYEGEHEHRLTIYGSKNSGRYKNTEHDVSAMPLAFAKSIEKNSEPPMPAQDIFDGLSVCFAFEKSLETRKPVKVEYI